MGTAERREREKRARFELIKKKAKKLFLKKGFVNTSLDEISEAAELSKGSIYLYFKSKSELLYSIMEPFLEKEISLLIELTSKDNEPVEKVLRKIVDFFYRSYSTDPVPYQLFQDYRAKDFDMKVGVERWINFKALMKEGLGAIEAVIARGIDQGVFKPVNPRVVSITMWNVILGIMRYEENRTYNGGKEHLKATLHVAIDLILNGLKVTGG